MKRVVRNVVAVIVGFAAGSLVNMAIVTWGPMLVPYPAGVDMGSAEGIAAGIDRLEPRHFAVPFLAHALGTLCGALVAAAIAGSRNAAWVIGALFLAGGVAAAYMIPAPAWFIAVDLLFAYLPMAWLAGVIGGRARRTR
jgi:hypothetical protein